MIYILISILISIKLDSLLNADIDTVSRLCEKRNLLDFRDGFEISVIKPFSIMEEIYYLVTQCVWTLCIITQNSKQYTKSCKRFNHNLFTFHYINIKSLTIKKHEHKRHTPQHITIYRSDKLVNQTNDKKT